MKHPVKHPVKSSGFTLVEILVAVVIAGILTAIAIPSYQTYVVKGNRAAAQSFMLEIENREKQYLLDVRSYTNSLTTLGVSTPAEVSRNYDITIAVSATPPAFTITAAPTPGGAQTNDGNLTLTSAGAKTHGSSNKW